MVSRALPDGSSEDGEGREVLSSDRDEEKGDGDDDDDDDDDGIPTKKRHVDVWLCQGLFPQFL